MPLQSGWLPFNRGLLLAYVGPLLIWTATSITAVVTLKDGLDSLENIERAERTLRLAAEYRDAFLLLHDGEHFYFDDPSPEARARRDGILRRANALFNEIGFLVRARPAQRERLEHAGASLQEWFHDVAAPRKPAAGPALVKAFEDSMTDFIAGEQRVLAVATSRADVLATRVQWIIWCGLALGVLAKIVAARWIASRIGRSVESINRAADELASGNMTARVRGKGETGDLAERFNAMADLIEKRNAQQAVLAELGEMLHNCRSTEEGKEVFGTFVDDLFPNKPGTLYFIEPNHNEVRAATSWQGGETHSATSMPVEECWALRLGRAHRNDDASKARCEHVHENEDSRCIPLPAFGGVIGLLFLVEGQEVDVEREQHQRFEDAVAEQVALAFANIRLREQLKEQSIRDALTELHNRRHLDEVVELELSRAARHDEPLSVLAFDIDHFKRFNDAHGHDGGDAVLRCIGETLRNFFRPEDGLFRSGGEEFVVLLPGTNAGDALLRAEALRREIATLKVMHGNVTLPPVSISVGVATWPANGKDAAALLKSADRALYRAKEAGRDCVVAA